ncbi:MAG: hypothetical protein RL127_1351 [Bacteroidota bacterium]
MRSMASRLYVTWIICALLFVGCFPLIGQTKSLYRTDELTKRQANATAFSKLRDSLYQKSQAQAKIQR